MEKLEDEELPVWYAMRATYNRGMDAKDFLSEEKVECFIPMHYKLVDAKNGRKKRVSVPVIKNLVFAKATSSRIKEVKAKVPYLQYIIGVDEEGRKPIIVPDAQMEAFIAVADTLDDRLTYLTPEEINLSDGVKVRIHGGFFDGREGVFKRIAGKRNRRMVIAIPGVIAVAIVITDFSYIEKLG